MLINFSVLPGLGLSNLFPPFQKQYHNVFIEFISRDKSEIFIKMVGEVDPPDGGCKVTNIM